MFGNLDSLIVNHSVFQICPGHPMHPQIKPGSLVFAAPVFLPQTQRKALTFSFHLQFSTDASSQKHQKTEPSLPPFQETLLSQTGGGVCSTSQQTAQCTTGQICVSSLCRIGACNFFHSLRCTLECLCLVFASKTDERFALRDDI